MSPIEFRPSKAGGGTGKGLQQSFLLPGPARSNLTPLKLAATRGSGLPDVPAGSTGLLPPWLGRLEQESGGTAVWQGEPLPPAQVRGSLLREGPQVATQPLALPSVVFPFPTPPCPFRASWVLIAAAWESKWLQFLNQWVHLCLDRSPSGFVTRPCLHNSHYKGSVTDMKELGQHSKLV